MADTKFTPGPWEISHQNGDPEEAFKGIIGPAQTNRIGKTYRTYVAQYVEPKNSHLIAAAPELYESLKDVLGLITPEFEQSPMVSFAKAALAKARGEAV